MCLHNWSASKGSLSIWIPEGVKFKVLCQDPGTPLHLMMEVGWLLVKQNVILLFIYAWVSLKVCVWCWFCGMGYWIAHCLAHCAVCCIIQNQCKHWMCFTCLWVWGLNESFSGWANENEKKKKYFLSIFRSTH